MMSLLYLNCLHVFRSRIVWFLLVVSFLLQFCLVKLVRSATLQFQGVLMQVGWKEALFLALFFQLFSGAFLATVYGIWLIPYAHNGVRGQLTFMLPVKKWYFPMVYALTLLGIIGFMHMAFLVYYLFLFGFAPFAEATFPWRGLIVSLSVETLCTLFLAYVFASLSLVVGQIATLFLASIGLGGLQLTALLFRLDLEHFFGELPPWFGLAKSVYLWLPPVGDLVFDLKEIFFRPWDVQVPWHVWGLWVVIASLVFLALIRSPSSAKPSEN